MFSIYHPSTMDFALIRYCVWLGCDFFFGVLNSANRPLFELNPKSSNKSVRLLVKIDLPKTYRFATQILDCRQWFRSVGFLFGRLIFHNQASTWHWINFNKHLIKLEIGLPFFSHDEKNSMRTKFAVIWENYSLRWNQFSRSLNFVRDDFRWSTTTIVDTGRARFMLLLYIIIKSEIDLERVVWLGTWTISKQLCTLFYSEKSKHFKICRFHISVSSVVKYVARRTTAQGQMTSSNHDFFFNSSILAFALQQIKQCNVIILLWVNQSIRFFFVSTQPNVPRRHRASWLINIFRNQKTKRK